MFSSSSVTDGSRGRYPRSKGRKYRCAVSTAPVVTGRCVEGDVVWVAGVPERVLIEDLVVTKRRVDLVDLVETSSVSSTLKRVEVYKRSFVDSRLLYTGRTNVVCADSL